MIKVRPATTADSIDIFTWRNDEHTRLMSKNSQLITPSEHEKWLTKTLASTDSCLLICTHEQYSKVAVVRFDIAAKNAEISINIAKEHRGKGLAIFCINSAIAYFTQHFRAYNCITAAIKKTNKASQKCFIKAGFCLQYTKGDMEYYSLIVSTPDLEATRIT